MFYLPLSEINMIFNKALRASPILLDKISSTCGCIIFNKSFAVEFNISDTLFNIFFIAVCVTEFILYLTIKRKKQNRSIFSNNLITYMNATLIY